MAKEISGFIKLQIKGGQANPAPPVGPALGQRGVNIMEFCKAFNDKTKSMAGKPVPVEITVYKDKKFDFKIKSPPASYFIKEAVKLKGGSKEPGRNIVASISKKQLEDIANQKMNDLFIKLESPALTDIHVNFPPEITSELAKDVIHDLYAGETITATFKMNALPDSLEITGKTIDGEFNKTITIDKISGTSGIDILWASRKIDRLTDIFNNTFSSKATALAKKDVTVSLSADGGDEIFAGYSKYDLCLNYLKKFHK